MSKKVLVISNYYDGTGWSRAGIDLILTLDLAGYDIVCRPIKLNNEVVPPPQRVLELEAKNDATPDVVIQHVLPHFMHYDARAGKNIGYYESETTFNDNNWLERLSCMDEIWVVCNEQKNYLQSQKITKPIHVVPHGIDIDKFNKNYPKVDNPVLQDQFIFYTIGEFNRRKNLGALVKAFHMEFDSDEAVQLLIKTSIHGKHPQEAAQLIKQFCDEIKTGLKKYANLYDYKKELIATDKLSEEDLGGLHRSCHCFVSASHGESCCYPAMDALGFGNPVVASATGGFLDYINLYEQNGALVYGEDERIFGAIDTFPDLCASNDEWFVPNLEKMMIAMRRIYTDVKSGKQTKENCIKTAYNYSYENIGKKIKEIL